MTAMTRTIQCDQFIAHPPAAVWRVLTDPRLHAKWWAAGDVRPEVGHRFTLDMGSWGQQPCEVLEVEPERLFLEHAGFDPDSPLAQKALIGMGNGWPGLLRRIGRCLEEPSYSSSARPSRQ